MNRSTQLITLAAGTFTAPALAQVNFDPPASYFVPDGGSGASPHYVAAGDLDGDGDIDLITDSNGPGNDPTTIFWNDGGGGFSMGPALTSGWGFGEVDLADMDSDGDLDVIRANYFSNGVYFFKNNGAGSFDPGIFYAGGGGCLGVIFTDIDGDKDPDFVALDKFGGHIRPYRNINGLGFSSVGLFDCGADPYTLEAADMDGDGDNDVVVGNEDAATLTLLYNDGTGAFPSSRTISVGERPTGIALADLNGDGHNDIVSADWGPLSPTSNTISVVLFDNDALPLPAFQITVQGRPGSVAVADIDGDALPDIVVSCEADASFVVLRGHGDGTFDDFVAFPAGFDPGSIALADFDGDADLDFASASGDSVVVSSNISGTPIEPTPYQVAWYTQYDNFFNEDLPTHITTDNAGNVIAGGSTYFSANENDIQVVKLDSQGSVLWEYVYNGDGDHYEVVYELETDADDNILITGESWGLNFSVQWATIKLDPDGNELWVRRYDGGNPQASQYPRGMAVSNTGSVAVGGWARDITFLSVHFSVVLYDAAGTVLFDAQSPGVTDADGQAESVAFDGAANVVATGMVDDDDEFGDEMLTVKLAPDGTVLWSNRHDVSDDPFFNQTMGRVIWADQSGNVYVGYEASGAAGGNARLIKYGADGTQLWDLGVAATGTPAKLTPRSDGTLLVSVNAGASSVRVIAVSPSGTTLWSTVADAAFPSNNSTGHLTLLPGGAFATIGQVGTDLSLVVHDAQGAFLNSTRVDSGSGSDFARAITSTPTGSVFLLGQVQTQILNRRDYSIFRMEPETPACPADFVEDGVLNFSDVLAFLTAFGADQPEADLAEPIGVWNFSDVVAFLAAFGAGCP